MIHRTTVDGKLYGGALEFECAGTSMVGQV